MTEVALWPEGVPHELVLTPDGTLTPRAENYLARRMESALVAQGRQGLMIVHSSNLARAMILRGEWVAECPRAPDCVNVEPLTDKPTKFRHKARYIEGPKLTMFHCRECDLVADIEWPPDADEIMEVLNRRPVPANRNWYPRGHLLAIRMDEPHGQTVADLLDENREHGVD